MSSRQRDDLLRRTVYIGTFLSCKSLTDLDVLEDTAVGVNENGVIAFIERGQSGQLEAAAQRLEWNDYSVVRQPDTNIGFWFPGFVDTHIHAPQFPNAGIFGKTTLLSWLNKYTFPVESSLSSIPKARSVYSRCITSTLAHGTTTASYYATTHVESTNLLADLCLSMGQRAFIGRCVMDSHIQPDYYKDSSPQEALDATKATIDHIASIDPKNRLIKPIITPRFAPSCTKECLTLLGKLANETGLPIQTHISENIAEIDLVAELFPQYSSYAAVYDACGLLTRETLLAHAIHLSEDELSLVKARGCSISHCPASNTSLGSGLCPVRDLLDAGIVVGLGTDVSGGYSPSILAAAREAGGVSRMRTAVMPKDLPQDEKDRMKLSVEETLYLATRGGAQCLGLDSEVGEFKVGKQWDAQFVDLGAPCAFDGTTEGNEGKGNVQVWEGTGWEERVNKWVFCGDDRNTKAVWVAGRLVSGHM